MYKLRMTHVNRAGVKTAMCTDGLGSFDAVHEFIEGYLNSLNVPPTTGISIVVTGPPPVYANGSGVLTQIRRAARSKTLCHTLNTEDP